MITFLRKIRKKLLSQGSMISYLPYAIGEIILVVIGILIAISLNNANQHKIEEKSLDDKLVKLRTEIYQDSLHFVYVNSFNQQINGEIEKVLQKLNGEMEYADYLEVIQLFQDKLKFKVFISKANTYNELVNSGDFSKIEDETLKEKISFLHSFYSHYANMTYADIDNVYSYNQKLYSDGIVAAKYFKPNLTEQEQKAGYLFFQKLLANPQKRMILENYLFKEQTFRQRVIRRYDTMLDLMKGLPLPPKE